MKRSRFNFQSAAERGLAKDDKFVPKQINQNEPDIFFPPFILPHQYNALNLSVHLSRKYNGESCPEQQAKVLNESQMTKFIQPQKESKISAVQDIQLNTQQSIQFQELSDENLGFYHNFLYEQSTEQNLEKRFCTNQSYFSQNQFYLNHSPKKRQSSFQINQNLKTLDYTTEKEDPYDVEEHMSFILKNNNSVQKVFKKDEDDASQDKKQQIFQTFQNTQNQVQLQIKTNKFKTYFLVVRAVFRMMILVRPKKKLWLQSQQLYFQLSKIFKFKDKQVQSKIKQWTQISLTKVLSVLKFQTLKQWNFIVIFLLRIQESNLEDFYKDLAITNFLNLCSHLISNLEITTQSQTFLPELGYQSYLEQFVEYRQSYNIFVTKRTNYLQNKYSKITPKEKAMIATECVLMNNFIPNLVLLTENKKIFNSDDQNIQFLIRGFISILQQLFITTFSDIPEVKKPNTQFQYQQMQIGKNKFGMILVPIQTDIEEFFKGTFKSDQLRLVLERRSWYSNLTKKFKKVVQNIYQHKINDI
ncbi:unnamed protein product (macronuclear) [Paramecium tetraurelia]|uniref:Ras-GEF domain-containing protein n=1 Tax=Paramecium tetraurelia TaxID=5888 RepID=A0BV30_PARTE|nr:uncharacterized protein GSPATT00005643001 [Paramecium tetraurelia]CAK62397.1 unnamed protein product [Paramecium tetraurelia]|eukprot:XP_001429795.1 hypothetical protein (macronuclear) [Paramecium tetraurelia strain d4-2]